MADDFKSVAVKSVDQQGKFTVALAGGRSPVMLYKMLASDPYRNSIPWNQSYIFWGDERAVPFDHNRNNAKMAFDTLLCHVPVPGDHIFRVNTAIPPEEAAESYEKQLKEYFSGTKPSFDLILLGMGTDGHTASIFPGSKLVHEQERWVGTSYNSSQKTQRISFTPPLINKAKHIFFGVYGKSKASTLKEILEGEYNPGLLPAQLVRPDNGEVVWYVDEGAAQSISAG